MGHLIFNCKFVIAGSFHLWKLIRNFAILLVILLFAAIILFPGLCKEF